MEVSSSKFSESMQKILNEYGDDVLEVTRRLVKKAGNEARDRLKKVSPRRPKSSKHYADGWTAGNYTWSTLGAHVTVYNAKKPGLAHLLENGHANRKGGRTPAYVHIKPVEEEVIRTLEENVRRAIENV